MVRTSILCFTLLLFFSCAKNPVEATDEAIDIALSFLSNGKCEEAISVLGEVGNQSSNPIYLQVLASAHACKANFSEVAFVADDLASMNTTSGATIFRSFSILSSSSEIIPDSNDYTDILTGLNVILNSTTGNPGQVSRSDKFGSRKAGDLGVQALILSIVNFGKFLNYYGNVSATGVKGGGTVSANTCFLNYNDTRATALTGVSTGACISDSAGHLELNQSTATGKRRLCEGLIYLTNILDILENIDLSNSSSLSKLEEVATKVVLFKTAAVTAGLGTLINMTSQSACETYIAAPLRLLDMEYFYALVFESGLQ